ncbi:MAG: FAD:protein FMN transferase [Blautia marasmi]
MVAYVDSVGSSVVSSGIYERYFEVDGKLYYHVLDPETGYPVETDLAQVTILSEGSLEGDALSTSCLILGYEKGGS